MKKRMDELECSSTTTSRTTPTDPPPFEELSLWAVFIEDVNNKDPP